jgi:hypothetical protein
MATAFIMLCVASLFLSGCQKNPDIPPRTPSCQILKIKDFVSQWGQPDSFVIAYNSKKNPVSITRGFIRTGSPHYLFRYDHKGRITDFYGVYEDPVNFNKDSIRFDLWHRYHYDSRNRIILDTAYEFGIVAGPDYIPRPDPNSTIPNVSVRYISRYTYDNYDRIIKSLETYAGTTIVLTRVFTYNQSGNLVKVEDQYNDGGTNIPTLYGPYDNRINYHRTNSIWQFLDRDYSMNNILPIDAYNNKGLPTSMPPGGHLSGYRTFATEFFMRAVIEYSCK